jgi:ComF family protein
LYAQELSDSRLLNRVDIIIPVPLHPRKLRKRGYNQSQCFAEGLSDITGIPVMANILVRKAHSSTQTKKSRYERWKNVEDIFGVVRPELIRGRHVLLVDDVITTGATVEACAAMLLSEDDVKVSVASIAFAAE